MVEELMLQSKTFSCNHFENDDSKKLKPVREVSFSSNSVFENDDFGYINKIVDPNKSKRNNPKYYSQISIFAGSSPGVSK